MKRHARLYAVITIFVLAITLSCCVVQLDRASAQSVVGNPLTLTPQPPPAKTPTPTSPPTAITLDYVEVTTPVVDNIIKAIITVLLLLAGFLFLLWVITHVRLVP